MIATLQQIVEKALDRLVAIITTYLPPLLAGLIILGAAFALAWLARWVLLHAIKATGFERFMVQSGLSATLGRSGRVRAARLVSAVAYWGILLAGALTALNAFDTQLTSRMVEAVLVLLPRLVTAGAIVIGGLWLGQYLGRSTLLWACNEGFPRARLLAGAARFAIVLVAVTIAADHLGFARNVFLAAFVLLAGGAVLAASLAAGLGARSAVERHLLEQKDRAHEDERTLWNHL
jgi:hypothetical protein